MSVHDSLDQMLQRLRELRLSLLRLHKALLESERAVYEQFYGRIRSTGEYFQLVTEHEWFSWLRPISQFIVQMDDVLHSKQPVVVDDVQKLLDEARRMFQPAEEGTSFERRYYRAIQRDPDIALAHAEVTKLLTASP